MRSKAGLTTSIAEAGKGGHLQLKLENGTAAGRLRQLLCLFLSTFSDSDTPSGRIFSEKEEMG